MAELSIHVFDVRDGDAIVVKMVNGNKTSYGVVDCHKVNINGDLWANPVLEFLESEGAKELSFAVLTHLHADHYWGLDEVVGRFPPKKLFLTPHLCATTDEFLETTLGKAKVFFESEKERVSGILHALKIFSLANFLEFTRKFILSGPENVEFPNGPESILRPPEFAEVCEVQVVQPVKAVKGRMRNQDVFSPEFFAPSNKDPNLFSLAIQIDFGGRKILLAGDSPNDAWKARKKQRIAVNADVVKVPHHGAANEAEVDTIRYLCSTETGECVAIFSTSGSDHHPSQAAIEGYSNNNCKLACTRRPNQCRGPGGGDFSFARMGKLPEWVKDLLYELNIGRDHNICKGNIEVRVDETGVITVYADHPVPCVWSDLQPDLSPRMAARIRRLLSGKMEVKSSGCTG